MNDANNRVVENIKEAYEFNYNVINTPWDDRSPKSKIGIVGLLISILVTIAACVIFNIVLHFQKTEHDKDDADAEIKCHLVKMGDHRYVARIHSVETQEVLCVGAVISATIVLANQICVQSGSVVLRIGSVSEPRCKKGFPVDRYEVIYQGVTPSGLVLLTINTNMAHCSKIMVVGDTLEFNMPVYILGRPLPNGKLMPWQPAKLMVVDKKHSSLENTICVTCHTGCPIRVGDLLLQRNKLFGLAITNTPIQNRTNCLRN
ncbi:hypothetical protein ACJJTC_001301 [Scirpophaga incertulas]